LASCPAWNRPATQSSPVRLSQTHVADRGHHADGELTQHRVPNDRAQLEPFFAQLSDRGVSYRDNWLTRNRTS